MPWTGYTLNDFLLFAPETYQRLFIRYHEAIWPLQIPVVIAMLVIPWLILRRGGVEPRMMRIALPILAVVWVWIGTDFLYQRYGEINWAAVWPAAGFMFQGVLLLATAFAEPEQPASVRVPPAARDAGLLVMSAAVILLPLAAPLSGRPWLSAELVGVTPDATALFTLGLLALKPLRLRLLLLPVPLLWCLFSTLTQIAMDWPDAWILPALAAAAVAATLLPREKVAAR